MYIRNSDNTPFRNVLTKFGIEVLLALFLKKSLFYSLDLNCL